MNDSPKGTSTTPTKYRINFGERTGRLVLVTTIVGALGIGYFKAFQLLMSSLSDKIYLKYYINHEHIITASLLSTAILLLITLVRYCYFELLALNNSLSENDGEKFIKADSAYQSIFEFASLYVILSITLIFSSFFILGILVANYITIVTLILILLIFSPFIFFKKIRKETQTGIARLIKYSIDKKWRILIWFATSISICFIIILITLSNQKMEFEVNFNKDNIQLHFKNVLPEKTVIQFISTLNESEQLNNEVILNGNDFSYSFVEVLQRSQESDRFLFTKILKTEMNKGSEAYLVSNSSYDYKYKVDLNGQLKTGTNYIVIEFVTTGLTEKHYRLLNQVNVDTQGNVLFNNERFHEKLNNL
ncbi:hypothetical protein [Paenibacillus daejeonensis]|uniref:hypothetical protein n=1 Tax=Paenibacillus daejeonensis TaxID=135193 RepID=UPI000363FFB3|nr:hypothetical protein [Paenibacillus daejeonensis]